MSLEAGAFYSIRETYLDAGNPTFVDFALIYSNEFVDFLYEENLQGLNKINAILLNTERIHRPSISRKIGFYKVFYNNRILYVVDYDKSSTLVFIKIS